MINLFRRIRQDLLRENKLSVYLIYGIGEVILVIIGIFIALQIDSWNGDRKLRQLERTLLSDIRNNLIASRTNLMSNIVYNKMTLSNYEQILIHIKEGLPYAISLDSAFSYISYWSDPKFTYTAYETIKTLGLDIIQNDSLKDYITEIYEQLFPFIIDEFKGEWELHQSLTLPFIAQHIQYINTDVARPNNFKDLAKNDEFHNLMGLKMITRKSSIQLAQEAQVKLDSLILMIDRELSIK